MTLISIFDLIDNDSYFRTELREKIEEVYPGIFDFSKNYFIKIEDWGKDTKDYEILIQILISLRYNKHSLNIYGARFNDKSSGILTRCNKVFIFGVFSLEEDRTFCDYLEMIGEERNIPVNYDNRYCGKDIKGDWVEIDVDEFISKIMEFANTLYITRRKVVFGLNY